MWLWRWAWRGGFGGWRGRRSSPQRASLASRLRRGRAVSLADVPVVFILVGLVAYAVLGFADFGAGFWYLAAGSESEKGRRSRDHALHGMAPVWEANHVWLIFVLVVAWTAFPEVFG